MIYYLSISKIKSAIIKARRDFMQIMILSDSHTMEKINVLSLLQKHNIDYYIHCGDIYMPYDGLPLSNFYVVKGNNDFSDIPTEIDTTIDGLHFFITYGHHYDIDYGIDTLAAHAKKIGADIVCFGHTHRPLVETIDNIVFINPGSVTFPRGGYLEPTYCILDTTTKKITFYDVKTNTPCNPFGAQKKKTSFFKDLFTK